MSESEFKQMSKNVLTQAADEQLPLFKEYSAATELEPFMRSFAQDADMQQALRNAEAAGMAQEIVQSILTTAARIVLRTPAK